MKKFFTVGLILSLFISMSSFAQVLYQNDFSSAAGTALTAEGWSAHSGGTTNAISIVSPGLQYNNYTPSGKGNAVSLTTSGQDVNHILSDSVSSGSLYTAMMVKVTSAQAPGDYFFNYMQNPTNTFDFLARTFVKLAANGKLAFGIGKSSTNATVPPVYSDSVYEIGTTYLLVAKLTINPDTNDNVASLFINPGLSASEPVATILSTTTSSSAKEPTFVGAIALRQGSGTNAANIVVDGIRVAKTWQDAVSFYLSLAQAREDLNSDFIPDNYTDTLRVRGIVISPNFQTSNRSYYIWDGTAGLDVFKTGLTSPALNLGDEIEVYGKIDHFRGLTEIAPFTDSNIVVLSTGNTLPDFQELTIAQYKANPEAYEGELIAIGDLTKISGNWPTTSNATLKFTDGTDTIDIFIDTDTDLNEAAEPTWPKDFVGIASQYSSASNVVNNGYQLIPRGMSDILPAGTIPVELVSMTASQLNSGVKLDWATATETNNKGFEVQRKADNGKYEMVGFVAGAGTTTERRTYTFIDKDVRSGKYSYRLKQIDYDGSVKFLREVEVEVSGNMPGKFALDQNFPNPFNPSTTIRFTLAVDSKVSIKLFNVLGQEIATLLNSSYQAGSHELKFNASHLNSGIYFYKIQANGIDGNSFTSVRKMMLTK